MARPVRRQKHTLKSSEAWTEIADVTGLPISHRRERGAVTSGWLGGGAKKWLCISYPFEFPLLSIDTQRSARL